MATPVRYPSGVSTQRITNPLGNYGMPDPTAWHTYFNDFDVYTAGDFTITDVGTDTTAVTDLNGGAILVTTGGTENDGRQHQVKGESFLLTAGKKTIFKARWKTGDATQTDILIGLAVLDTTLLGAAAGDGVTDGVFFQKDDGSTTLTCYCQKDTTTGQTSVAADVIADDTFVTSAWVYDGVSTITVYADDVAVGTLTASSTYLPDTELTVSFAILTGETGANTLTIDYIFVAQER